MVNLQNFNLSSLRELYNELKVLGYFFNVKNYQLNKFDMVTMLQNTNLFDEQHEEYVLFFHPEEKKWNKLYPVKRKYNRHRNNPGIKITRGEVVLKFE